MGKLSFRPIPANRHGWANLAQRDCGPHIGSVNMATSIIWSSNYPEHRPIWSCIISMIDNPLLLDARLALTLLVFRRDFEKQGCFNNNSLLQQSHCEASQIDGTGWELHRVCLVNCTCWKSGAATASALQRQELKLTKLQQLPPLEISSPSFSCQSSLVDEEYNVITYATKAHGLSFVDSLLPSVVSREESVQGQMDLTLPSIGKKYWRDPWPLKNEEKTQFASDQVFFTSCLVLTTHKNWTCEQSIDTVQYTHPQVPSLHRSSVLTSARQQMPCQLASKARLSFR